MTRFPFDQLQALAAVVEEGTFEAAARRLHVSASAVSQRIKALEHSAGGVLVQRSTPVEPTTAGDTMLRYARQVQLLEHDATVQLARGLREDGRITIPLAVNADSLATWFLPAIADLASSHEVVFDIRREDQEYTTALLRSGTVLGAVTSTREAVQGCSSAVLGIMRYRAVCSPAFLDRYLGGSVGEHRLLTAPMVDFDRKDELQRRFLTEVVGADAHPARHLIPTSADFARAIGFGLGWGLLPEQQCGAELTSGRLVELAPRHPVDVRLFWQRWNLDSPLLSEVTAAIQEAAGTSLRRA